MQHSEKRNEHSRGLLGFVDVHIGIDLIQPGDHVQKILDHKVGLIRVRRRCRVLLGRECGDDLNGFAEARLLGADDVTGDRIAHIYAVFGSGLHLPQRNAEDLRMGFAIAGHAGNRHILHAASDAVLLQHVEHVVKGGIVGNDAETLWTRTQKADRETGC